MTLIETKRLQLREYTLRDAPFIYELMNSEGWLKYIGDRKIHTVKDAEAYIEKSYLPCYKDPGYGAFIVELKETGTPIGSCGLYKRKDLEHPDVGFAFLTEYTHKGYGFESAQAVMEYAKNTLNMTTILGFTVSYNTASIKLLEKLGLKRSGTYTFKDDPEELLLFST